MKKNTKGYVKLSIILYIVILSVALVSTLAWFVFKQSATIDTEENSKIVVGEYLEICFDDGDTDDTNDEWSSRLSLASDAKFPDVSVTPEGKVWYPRALDDDDGLLFGEAGKGNYIDVTDAPDGYFVKLDLKIRSSKAVDVYLDSTSLVEGVNMEKEDGTIKEAETDEEGKLNVITKDVFSKDAVVGAARVAFFERDASGAKTLTKMWVPNTDYHLNVENGAFEENCTCTEKETYKYLNVAANGTVASANGGCSIWDDGVEDNQKKVMVGSDVLSTGGMIGDATPVLSFSEADTKKITVYIWVEGTDREASTLLSGGSIKYSLTFVGIGKTASTYDIESVYYKDGRLYKNDGNDEVDDVEVPANELLYSRDGLEWYPYPDSDVPDLGTFEKIYICAQETATQKQGDPRQVK